MGVSLQRVLAEIGLLVDYGSSESAAEDPVETPRLKRVLASAPKEAASLGHAYIGTEHILLGLLRHDSGCAAAVLRRMGVDPERVRQEIQHMIDPSH